MLFQSERPVIAGQVLGPIERYSSVVPLSSVALASLVLENNKLTNESKKLIKKTWEWMSRKANQPPDSQLDQAESAPGPKKPRKAQHG